MKRTRTNANFNIIARQSQHRRTVLIFVCYFVSPHPYLFFNEDHITMTFLGFYINSAGDLVDPQEGKILEKGLMSKQLRNGLQAQRVDFATNTENLKK